MTLNVFEMNIEETYFGHKHRTVIEPPKGWMPVNIKEVWAYRELLGMLAWRDISVRYKQTLAGVGWAVIQPVMTMIIFTIIFGKFAKLPSDGIPYPLFSFCALLPWNYFSQSLSGSSDSLVGASNLITKVYFPRLVIPLSRVFAGLVDFAIAFVVLLGMMLWYGVAPGGRVIALPFFLLVAIVTALGVGLWLTALNVKYRDVRFVVPFLAQFWLYASPVAYATSLVPEKWRFIYGLNPMVGVIEGFRWALLGKSSPDFGMMTVSLSIVIGILVTGLFYFRKMEQTFADVV